MKLAIVFAALVAAVLAVPVPEDKKGVYTVKSEFDNIGIDKYNFGFENSDGHAQSEVGELKNIGSEHESMTVQGHATWTDAYGKWVLEYTADENGFHSEGIKLIK